MSVSFGEVIAVHGTKITLKVFDESSLETIFYEGKKYKGVSIREYIGIKRGFCLIVCIVEGEYLDEKRFEQDGNKLQYLRKVEAKPIGYFDREVFKEGIKLVPMIKDEGKLLSEDQVVKIFSQANDGKFQIGSMLKEGLPVSLPWQKLFNSHIGIFGNTGSGKSNTLAKLYGELFSNFESNLSSVSQFFLVDFNGEYTGNQLISDSCNKRSFILSTGDTSGDRLPLSNDQLWNVEVLALLFQATANTQTPFLNRVVEGRKRYRANPDSLKNYTLKTFESCLVTTAQDSELLLYLKVIAKHLGDSRLIDKLNEIIWSNKYSSFAIVKDSGNWIWFGGQENFNTHIKTLIDDADFSSIDEFDELIMRINIQLLRELLIGYVQFEHIQPLLKRVESAVGNLRHVFDVRESIGDEFKLLNVISLRGCNQSTKKIVPLILTKMFYQKHREKVGIEVKNTLHFIIDEAHNILSQQSSREHEIWKDYRLEMFEEIIKEGRKFGIFLTLASQRPADISPTIMSQIHNFFIHRLVNDKDLFLIDNTISTLDHMAKSMIPNLSKGVCVVTGTAFDLPIVMQVKYIEDKSSRPASDDVDLEKLWGRESQE